MNVEVHLGRGLAEGLANRPWVLDGINELELSTLSHLATISTSAEVHPNLILHMQFLDTVEASDLHELSTMSVLVETPYGRSLLRALVERGWAGDGLNELETAVITALREFAGDAEAEALRILAMPFLQTVEAADRRAVETLAGLRLGKLDVLRAVLRKGWVEDGLDDTEIRVIRAIEALARNARSDAFGVLALPFLKTVETADAIAVEALSGLGVARPETLRAVLKKWWVKDGIDDAESFLLLELGRLVERDAVARLWIAAIPNGGGNVPFKEGSACRPFDSDNNGRIEHQDVHSAVTAHLRGELSRDDMLEVFGIYVFSEEFARDPDIRELVGVTEWIQDGLNWTDDYASELNVSEDLMQVHDSNPDLAKVISRWASLFDAELTALETYALGYVVGLSDEHPVLAQNLAGMPWLHDGIERWESSALGDFYRAAIHHNPEYALELSTAWWLLDGLTPTEAYKGLRPLTNLANPSAAYYPTMEVVRRIQGLIRNPASDLDFHAVAAIERMLRSDLDRFLPLLDSPWFVDGLDDSERAMIAVVGGTGIYPRVFDRHDVSLKTIELPLSGSIRLWLVKLAGWHPDNEYLQRMEDGLRSMEDVWGVPLPAREVYLYAGARAARIYPGFGGIMISHPFGTSIPFYLSAARFYLNDGPYWFMEGGVQLMGRDLAGIGYDIEGASVESCAEVGFEDVEATNHPKPGMASHPCVEFLGMRFLLALRDTMGEEAWLAAMRGVYAEFGQAGQQYYRSADDEDVYRIFLQHTPSALVGEFKEVFRRMHGGPFLDEED